MAIFLKRNENFWQFFFEKIVKFLAIFDIQMPIFRRVRSDPMGEMCCVITLTSDVVGPLYGHVLSHVVIALRHVGRTDDDLLLRGMELNVFPQT